jgi:phosphatidylinositol alpha-1,6-mannosyltransferase
VTGRVLVVTNDFPPRRGGIESFVLSLCAGLDPEQVVVYTATMPGSGETDPRLPFPVVRDRSTMLVPTFAVARRVRAAYTEFGCDRVLFGASAPLGLLAGGLRRAGADPIVALTHGHEVWWAAIPGWRRLLRRIGEQTDVLTYISEHCRVAISRALTPEVAARMVHLSPGVDVDRFRRGLDGSVWRDRWGVEPGAQVVLAASRLVRRKGHDRLIDAWSRVVAACPNAVLVVLGDGRRSQALRRRCRRLRVDASVRVVSGVPWQEMPSVYAAAEVFALPCRTLRLGLESEGLGIVFLEAAAAGLPVVVGRSGGAPDTVIDDKTGFVVDPHDLDAIAGRVIELITGPTTAARMGEEGRRWVSEAFALPATQARLRELLGFARVAAPRPGAAPGQGRQG